MGFNILDMILPRAQEVTFTRASDGAAVTIFPPAGVSAKAWRDELLNGIEEGNLSAILNRNAALQAKRESAVKNMEQRKADVVCVSALSLDCE